MADSQGNNWELEWEFLVADAWADADLMDRLLREPAAVLHERGVNIP